MRAAGLTIGLMKTLERLCNIRSLLPKPTGNEDFDLFPRLTELDSRCLLELFLGSLKSWEKSLEGLHKIFTETPVFGLLLV